MTTQEALKSIEQGGWEILPSVEIRHALAVTKAAIAWHAKFDNIYTSRGAFDRDMAHVLQEVMYGRTPDHDEKRS